MKELIYYHHDALNKQEEVVDGKQVFGVKGCKFGRDSGNDYSYPD